MGSSYPCTLGLRLQPVFFRSGWNLLRAWFGLDVIDFRRHPFCPLVPHMMGVLEEVVTPSQPRHEPLYPVPILSSGKFVVTT